MHGFPLRLPGSTVIRSNNSTDRRYVGAIQQVNHRLCPRAPSIRGRYPECEQPQPPKLSIVSNRHFTLPPALMNSSIGVANGVNPHC